MIIIFTLLGALDTHIPPKVFDLLEQLPFNGPSQFTLAMSPILGLRNLSCSASWRYINSLMYDSSIKSAQLALRCLPLILATSRSSPVLNEACLLGRPFAYAATENHNLSALAHDAYNAMQDYRERYAKAQLGVTG